MALNLNTVVTIVGNLTADPELRFTQQGVAVVNFTIASTPRVFDRQTNEWKDGEAVFLRCSQWRDAGENVANSLKKGMRVIAVGELKTNKYETKDGEQRSSMELVVDEVGPSLRYSTAEVRRNARPDQQADPQGFRSGTQQAQANPAQSQQAQAPTDPWATGGPQGGATNSFADEPPF